MVKVGLRSPAEIQIATFGLKIRPVRSLRPSVLGGERPCRSGEWNFRDCIVESMQDDHISHPLKTFYHEIELKRAQRDNGF